VRGEPDGPVKFHYPAPPIGADFGVGTRTAGAAA
jgi:phospholipid/cholesterol/gamma-HCH transport system ATP-binding protein